MYVMCIAFVCVCVWAVGNFALRMSAEHIVYTHLRAWHNILYYVDIDASHSTTH